MAISGSVKRRLEGEVFATKDDVVATCQSVAKAVNRSWKVSTNASKVTLDMGFHFVAGVTLAPGQEGSVKLQARAEHWRTRQSKLFFVIPIGPKTIIGARAYNNYLDALESQLKVLDGGRGRLTQVEA